MERKGTDDRYQFRELLGSGGAGSVWLVEVEALLAVAREALLVATIGARALAPGEASCIAHAAAHGGIVVTDDRTARVCCKERNIVCTGTIGILKACTMDGTLTGDEADAILHAMVDASYYAPVQNISDLA